MSIAHRIFHSADQLRFAQLSGDHNPIHMDPVRARRTIAAEPVVHGVHLLLWALDAFAVQEVAPPPLSAIAVQFSRFVRVDEQVVLLAEPTATGTRLRVVAGNTVRCDIRLTFGPPTTAPQTLTVAQASWTSVAEQALDIPLDAISGRSGRLRFATPPIQIAEAFPAAAAWIGNARVAALAATTRLVGMIYPGLHSIYTGLRLTMVENAGCDEEITFVMDEVRHRLVAADVQGGGVAGRIEAFARTPPARQPSVAELTGRIPADAFAGATVLVVGGTRGLGELTAKLVASGGARVVITYRVGREEADAVAADIRSQGFVCDTLRYEVGVPAAEQLAQFGEPPSHAYYFAAPTIARPGSTFFDRNRLAELEAIFVDGFWSLATALYARRRDVALFYPSTTFVMERPKGMAEYAMAKAAGEILCAEMNATMAPLTVTVSRLPRLFTDQTAGVSGADALANIDALLPSILEVQASR